MDYFLIEICDEKLVKDPDSGLYLEKGKAYRKPKKQFWLRRLEAGDMKLVEQKQPKRKKSAKKSEEIEGEA